MTDDNANKDGTAGEIAGPVFLPLRPRPAATAANETPASDETTGERRTEATGRRRRPAGRLRFAPSR